MNLKVIITVTLLIIISMAVAVHAQGVSSGSPQYFTCTEVVPGVGGSNESHVIVWLRLSNVTTPNGLNYLLNQMYYNPSSPYYHRFITPQEFAQWYSPPSHVFSYIENLASKYGLSIMYTFPMLIEASGNASAVDKFLTALQSAPPSIQRWILAGECIPLGYFAASKSVPNYTPQIQLTPANASSAEIEEALGENVTYINGIPMQVRIHQLEIWLPEGLEFIYDEYPLLMRGFNGSGLTIAIVDAFGDFQGALTAYFYGIPPSTYQSVACSDLYTFDEIFGLPNPPTCTVIYPTGVPVITSYTASEAGGWAFETALDIEYAHTMAPGANILLVIAPDSGDDLFVDVEYVVNNTLADFISLSWGAFEDMFYIPPVSYNLLFGYDEIFMQAAAEGIGVFAASGDSGAFDIYVSPVEPSVLYPASDPWVTGVGGTTLKAVISPVMTERVEYAWNWNARYMWGSGGGYSFTFPETVGQALIHIVYERTVVYEPLLAQVYPELGYFYTVSHRGVPDIAADANPFTGVLIVLNGVISPFIIGGTSLATPLSAGMTTTTQSYLYATGINYGIGDLAPNLYLLYYYYPAVFYVPYEASYPTYEFFTGIPGAMFETLGGQNGLYWVIQGQWNPVDGLGQINVYGLSQALQLFAK
ncbi:S53 family peptidase [Vulcanisaeta thermophila]|uniref:S53 family peptidase n=1 Tax=Vulcanisaeta thermophila TaxID=867917 RepID=UPI000A78A534|nr:S53 family peptidase [Vulcanisaeta thermophila]